MNGLRPAPESKIVAELLGGAAGAAARPGEGPSETSREGAGFLGALQDQVERELREDAGEQGALFAAAGMPQTPAVNEASSEPSVPREERLREQAIDLAGAFKNSSKNSLVLISPEAPEKPGLKPESVLGPEVPASPILPKDAALLNGLAEPDSSVSSRNPASIPDPEPMMIPGGLDWRSAVPAGSDADLEEFSFQESLPRQKTGMNRVSDAANTGLSILKQPSGLPARASTEDFLSLRGILPKKSEREEASMEGAGTAPSFAPVGRLPADSQLEAPVMKSPSGNPMIAKDALERISQQVNLLGQARKDGEIKIRLRPDHLGELMMSVKTSGRTVSLEIKAQDPEAKKIIEESIESLRDSLSQKSLDLAKVDIVAQPQRSGESEFGSQMDFGSQQRGFRQESAGQEQGFAGRDRQEFPLDAPVASSTLKSRGIGARPGRSSGSGTLDLIA